MKLTLNGQPRDLPDGCTVAQLLEHLELQGERIAVECNGEIIQRSDFAAHVLKSGDTVEVVRFVGGG